MDGDAGRAGAPGMGRDGFSVKPVPETRNSIPARTPAESIAGGVQRKLPAIEETRVAARAACSARERGRVATDNHDSGLAAERIRARAIPLWILTGPLSPPPE
jgi:hypothetical protein